jgi:hypothetical protein
MIRQFSLLALIGFSLMGSLVLSAQNSDQTPTPAVMQAVEAAFPVSLRFVPAPPEGKGTLAQPYHSCASVFRTMQNGTPDLIAAGYSGHGSEVAMLAYQQGEAHIINASPILEKGLMDEGCEINIVNLADPKEPNWPLANAIDVSFSGGPVWFLTWGGNELQNITALVPGSGLPAYNIPPRSAMSSGDIVDIDHSGPMQIVGSNGDGDTFPQEEDGISATGTLTLFRFNGTTYAPAKRNLLECEEYEPNLPKTPDEQTFYKGDIGPWMSYIDMHTPPAPGYQLKIINGDRDGSNRVTSAKVDINGVTIISPTEVDQSVETLTRTIQLQKQNKIKVTVDGPAKSHVYVTVE